LGIQLGETHQAKILNKGKRIEDGIPYVLVEIEERVAETILLDSRTFNNLPNVGQYIFVRNSGLDIQTGYEVILNVPEGMKDPNSFFANTQFPILLLIYSIIGIMSNPLSAAIGIFIAALIMKTESKEGLQLCLVFSVIVLTGITLSWMFYWFLGNLIINAITGVLFVFGWILVFGAFGLMCQVKDRK